MILSLNFGLISQHNLLKVSKPMPKVPNRGPGFGDRHCRAGESWLILSSILILLTISHPPHVLTSLHIKPNSKVTN